MSNRYRDALAVPEFRAIFLAHVISMAGTVLAQLALTVLVYSRTGSPLLAALVFSVGLLPHLIAGTLLSALAVRVPIRRLLVTCNVISAVLAALMVAPGTPVVGLLALAFALGLIRPVFLGARSATLPEVLPGPGYVPGRSLIRLVAQTAQVAGFAVGGILLTTVSPQALLLGNAVAFAASALVLRLGTVERRLSSREPAVPSLLKDSLAGFRDVMLVVPLRRILVLGWAASALAVTPEALAVPYAASMSAGTFGAGLMLTAIPLGTVVGEVLTNWLASASRQVRVVGPSLALAFAPMFWFAARPSIEFATAALFISGLGAGYHLGLDRLLLDVAPAELRARALSNQAAGLMFWVGIGFGVAGATAEFLAPSIVIPVAAGCGTLLTVWYTFAAQPSRTTDVVESAELST